MSRSYDLVVIGAGSGGLVGATFAAQLGARVVLVEKNRIGGDCTWTGCVPSKALLRVARVAHELRRAGEYGLTTSPPCTDMGQVAAYVRRAIAAVYTYETPAALAEKGIEFVAGNAEFLDQRNVRVGDAVLSARRFLICTGARAVIPPVSGLTDVPFLTYERFFENERLPAHLLIIGSGPIALEMAVAYRRLGAEVSVVGRRILPREDDDVRAFVTDVLHRERIRVIEGAATDASYRVTAESSVSP